MKTSSSFLLCVCYCLCVQTSIQAQTTAPKTAHFKEKIDTYIQHFSERHQVPGVSLAIIQNGKLIHRKNYGKANLEHGVPMTDASIFRVYSLTKPIVAVGLFQLIEQGKLSLEDPIEKYVKDLPETWNGIQIKYLLTHSSGLPDMAPFPVFQDLTEAEAKERVFADTLSFAKGSQYRYNQTNFWLLRKVMEKISGETFEDFIIHNQFGKEESRETVFFSVDSREVVPNRVTPYFPFRTGEMIIDHSYGTGNYLEAANGLNITVEKFIEWDEKLRNNRLISAATKEKMWQLFPYQQSSRKFAYSWDAREVNGHPSFGFSGSLVTAYRIFPEDNLSIILFANGLGSFFNIDNIVNHVASLVNPAIEDVNNTVFENLLQVATEKNIAEVKSRFLALKKDTAFKKVNFENQLNAVGYMLINLNQLDKAIDVFQLNTQEFPTSWNAYDSLGEAYEHKGDVKNAILNYKKSMTLNAADERGNTSRLETHIKNLE